VSTPPGATAPSDVLERRTVTLAAVVALVMVLDTGTFGVALFGISTWSVALYVAALAAEVASLVLCSALLVPEDVRQRLPAGLRRPVPASERRGELFFWAFALFVLALVLTAVRVAVGAVDLLGRPSPFGFE
jgi:hypothetical protein